jgi:hypothetical protein
MERNIVITPLEKRYIITVKYSCNRVIFMVIPLNSNNIIFIGSCYNMWRDNRLRQQFFFVWLQ